VATSGPEPIRIGAIYNLTGSQEPLDAPSLDGARLAVDRINAGGGLLGRRVELVERDGQTDLAVVKQVAADLVGQHVSAMIGLSDTDQVLAAAPVAARAGIPFVTSGATSPRLTTQVPDWLFLACFGDNTQAAAGAEFAVNHLRSRTVAILYDKNMDYTRLLASYFAQSFRAQGGEVVARTAFAGGTRNVARLLEHGQDSTDETDDEDDGRLSAASADLLYVAAGPEDAGPLLRRLRAAGYRRPIMGGDSYDSPDLLAAAEATGGNVYYTTHVALGIARETPDMRRFENRYKSAYGRLPENAFAGLGFDAVNLVAAAIVVAGSSDPDAVRAALQAQRRFDGITGRLSYTTAGRVPRKQVTIMMVTKRPELAAEIAPRYVPQP
jgi:branched-chain amino acid transport system substrate-binding protein